MSCCIGLPPHKAGECAGVSCHVALAQNASHDKHGKVHDTHDDRHNTAAAHETAAHHQHESQAQPTATHNEASHHAHAEEAHHAEARQASESSATTDAEHASSKSKRERRPNVAPASLANPCPSDCGMAAGNARNNVRPRDAATLTAAHRPRPHARLADSKHSSNLPLASAGKRRLAPPRAPPLAL
ncbi:MAG TPA: hypothetical protein VJ842_10525 [Pyrinomonadaceae bacterium]|nr:hypothetical protein [Pyrinomonadaceae bacterium]